ncbi:aminotransferase class V-fold PLP-dependent enzyme [Candidatus Pacearchaeota archaeon]|nr:aminotransferase class V-fold PLP-dependent enzyme [Candidatus Pacearchaeota archaeon]
MMYVYLDNGATTQVDPRVTGKIIKYMNDRYGNASSLHFKGREAKKALDKARHTIASSINARADEIYFTSGGTEGNNLILKGVAFANREKGNHIITTKVEHKCVLESCKWLEKQGFKITYLDVDEEGFVDIEQLKNAISDRTILVSVIHGNNEIGTINDLKEIGRICGEKGVYFHSDACQSYTKVAIDVQEMPVDLLTLNAHKIHGPKGVGAIYVRDGVKIEGWQHGGFHEMGIRAGTENIHGIVGFAEAVKLSLSSKHISYMTRLRDKLIDGVMTRIPYVRLNGPRGEKRLCNNAHFSFKFIEGEAINGLLDDYGICGSTGSACSEKTLEPSYVLKSLGLNHEMMNGSLRMTLSRFTTEEEIDYVLEVLPLVIRRLREISPFKEEQHVFNRDA